MTPHALSNTLTATCTYWDEIYFRLRRKTCALQHMMSSWTVCVMNIVWLQAIIFRPPHVIQDCQIVAAFHSSPLFKPIPPHVICAMPSKRPQNFIYTIWYVPDKVRALCALTHLGPLYNATRTLLSRHCRKAPETFRITRALKKGSIVFCWTWMFRTHLATTLTLTKSNTNSAQSD